MSMFAQAFALLPAACALIVFLLLIADQREAAQMDGVEHLKSGATPEDDQEIETSAA